MLRDGADWMDAVRTDSVNATGAESKHQEASLKARALALLSKREYSRRELARKLAAHAQDADALESLLDDLAREKWLSDERYAQSLIHRQAPRLGARRITHTLREQGVDADTVAELAAQLHDTEEDRARAIWQKKFGTPPADAKEHARQLRFMVYRGFSPGVLRRIINDARDLDAEAD